MTRVLLLIDVQADYFPGGALPLVGPEAAAAAAGRVLRAFRALGAPVVHVRHEDPDPAAELLAASSPGLALHPAVTPGPDEQVVTKAQPNAFVGTDLAERLVALGADELVVAGMMTSMCVDSTVRSAVERGFGVTVVSDACAAPDLEHEDVAVPGALVHAAFLAALADGWATVVRSEHLVDELAAGAPSAFAAPPA